MKDLPKRSSRGKRINQLVGEEEEEDNIFWNQDAFQEKNDDENFSTNDESSDSDSVDSDFDDPEIDDILEEDENDKKKDKKKTKSKYIDPAKLRNKRKNINKETKVKKIIEIQNVDREMRSSTADKVLISEIRRQLDDEEKEFCVYFDKIIDSL